jgi:glutathione S-transferase
LQIPVLYSYRRCPYAMRARMALAYANIAVEIREVSLKQKPASMLQLSPKGTVPVLVLTDGKVIEQSLDIIDWALQQSDTDDWKMQDDLRQQTLANELIYLNDGAFKQALDKYKYAIRFPENPPAIYRTQGEQFLQRLESLLNKAPYLCRETCSKADIAIFPFVRQFSMVDEAWFEAANYPALKTWLNGLLRSDLFTKVMQKYPTWLD